ncbi:adenylyl-sulfate kinase [Natronospora cellulosivora (SeqCode)]
MVEKKLNNNIVWHNGKVSYQDRCENLGQKGIVLWFTGLSASGKSTIAVELEKALLEKGKTTYRLDGDNIRHGLNSDLGFSSQDRKENIRRIAEVAALFRDAGIITLASFITPYKESRELARNSIGDEFFKEIYVKADIETCQKRDPKGLYKKALAGEIKDFTGVSAPYEEPIDPFLVLDTDKLTVEECVNKIFELID